MAVPEMPMKLVVRKIKLGISQTKQSDNSLDSY